MLLKDLRAIAPLFGGRLINKSFKHKGNDALLALLSSKDEQNVFYILYNLPEPDITFDEPFSRSATNREIHMRSFETHKKHPHMHIKEININGEKFEISSSSGQRLNYNDFNTMMLIQHLWDLGVDTSVLDNAAAKDIFIYSYGIRNNNPIPEISPPYTDVNLIFGEEHRQMYIGGSYTLELGKDIPDERLSFYDTESGQEKYFYLNKLERYDMWKEIERLEKEEAYKKAVNENNFSKEHIEQMKKLRNEAMEQICPKGYDLAIIEYETEDDIQLQFYDEEYLDTIPEPVSNGSAFALLRSKDDEGSRHGFIPRCCIIKKIPKDFMGTITIELFSCYIRIPEEVCNL